MSLHRWSAALVVVHLAAIGAGAAPRTRRSPAEVAQMRALALRTFDELKRVFPRPATLPALEFTDDRSPGAQTNERGVVTVTSGMLEACAAGPRSLSREVVRKRVAFVLAHELAHVSRGDPRNFGLNGSLLPEVERIADEEAMGALIIAGLDPEPPDLRQFLRAIGLPPAQIESRARTVDRALRAARQRAPEWHVAWLLAVAGRFEDARDLYLGFSTKYHLPPATTALAHTRLLAAWRRYPCAEAPLVEWLPPIRFDPRSQIAPFVVRSADSSCEPFREELERAAEELVGAGSYPPALVTLASVRLLQGRPTIDPTAGLGGVTRIGGACRPSADADRARAALEADACQVSLLSQYELADRSDLARRAAIDGLERLRERSPNDSAILFNLARLLAHADRPGAAGPLWAAFLDDAPHGVYRDEAERQPLGTIPIRPELPTDPELATPANAHDPLVSRAGGCGARSSRPLSLSSGSSLRYCGSWNDEVAVQTVAGPLLRSVNAASKHWPNARPPEARPVFVSAVTGGATVRIWEREAWVYRDGAPERVVYFKRPR